MVQSDALSRWPDFVPAKDMDNKNMTLLPENLFLNLLDLTLQDRVLGLGQFDNFLKGFSTDDPLFGTSDDWKLDFIDGRNTLFYRGETTSLTTWTCSVTLWKCYMIMRQLVTQGKLRLWYQSKGYTGGLDFKLLSGIMWEGVVFASSTRLIVHPPIPPTCWSLRLWQPVLLCIAPWTWSQICRYLMASILFWLWSIVALRRGCFYSPVNDYGRTSGKSIIRKSLQTIWLTWQNYFGLRTTVCRTCILWASETPQHNQQVVDSLSPTDGQSYWMSKPRNRSLSFNLLFIVSRRMGQETIFGQVYTQQQMTCRTKTLSFQTHAWGIPQNTTNNIWKD